MNRDAFLKELNDKFPNHNFKISEEFGSDYAGGIWTCGEDTEQKYYGLPLFNYYANSKRYELGVNVKFNEFLEGKGWFCEWYDAGTMMIWKI